MEFNNATAAKCVELLGGIVDQCKLTRDRMHTRISTASESKSKIISGKGRQQVGALSSAEWGTTTTAEVFFSASGKWLVELLGSVFIRAPTMTTAINAFIKAGIWLSRPNVFTGGNFLPAETTLRLIHEIWRQLHLDAAAIRRRPSDQPRRHRSHLMRPVVTCLTHLETVMMVILLQRLLETVYEPVCATKLLLQRFCKYLLLANRTWWWHTVAVEQSFWPRLPANKTLKYPS
jgi:hypothetical protein